VHKRAVCQRSEGEESEDHILCHLDILMSRVNTSAAVRLRATSARNSSKVTYFLFVLSS
jgi:hypothetical protein